MLRLVVTLFKCLQRHFMTSLLPLFLVSRPYILLDVRWVPRLVWLSRNWSGNNVKLMLSLPYITAGVDVCGKTAKWMVWVSGDIVGAMELIQWSIIGPIPTCHMTVAFIIFLSVQSHFRWAPTSLCFSIIITMDGSSTVEIASKFTFTASLTQLISLLIDYIF